MSEGFKFQLRGDTAAGWTAANPVLLEREIGLELDTRKFKIGDGATAWSGLTYWTAGAAGGPITLDSLTDVDTTGLSPGDVLTYDGADWSPQPPDPVPATLDDLTDVTTTGAVSGNVLGYNGTNWLPTTPAAVGSGDGPGTEVYFSSLTGATDDAKLAAGMTAINALTLRGVTIVLDENRDYTFHNQVTLYNGFSIRGAFRPQDQARSSRPIGNRVLLRMTGTGLPKGWLKPPAGNIFGVSVTNLSIDADASSCLVDGNEDVTGVLWTSVFRDISIQNAYSVLGKPTNKLLVTACTVDGWWNINNVQERAWQIGGSDFFFQPSMMLLDSPPTVLADSKYLASMDFISNSWWSNVYCTAEQHSGLLLTASSSLTSTSSTSNWLRQWVIEGRNSGAPCYGALIRVTGGFWFMRDLRLAFAMANPALSGHGDKGVVHVAGGVVTLDGVTYEKGSTPESTPLLYASAGKVRVSNVQAIGTWTGKPIVKQSVAGLITADDTVTLQTALAAAPLTGAGNVTSGAANTGTTLTINKPANLADGDLLVAVVGARASSAVYTTPPTGWTRVDPNVDNTAAGVIRLYYKKITTASGEAASYTWAGGASGRHAGVMFRVTGHDTTVPIDGTAGDVATLVSTPDRIILPAVTTVTENALLVALGWSSTTGGTIGTFTRAGMTQVGTANTTTGASESAMTALTETVPAVGSTGTRSITGSPTAAYSTGSGYMVAIRSAG